LVQLQQYNIFINQKFSRYDIINRTLFSTAWGLATIVSAVIACGIPAALYFARNKKWPLLCFLLAVVFFASSFIVNTRSAMIFGGLSLFVGTLCALSGKIKRKIRVIVAVVFLIALIALLVLFRMIPDGGKELIKNLTLTLRLDFSKGDTFWQKLLGSRYDIWVRGIKDFLRAPLFGTGFVSGDYALNRVYDNMYHNIVIEFMGSMGIVGILAFLFHIFVILKVLLHKFSANKLLLLCVPLSILGMSLFDNFFFYPNFIIIYAAFLACAELYDETSECEIK
jgi:O-antigen ligase